MKIAQILGRGIEGAGVTRYAIELYLYLKKHGIQTELFVVDDKKWGRASAQDVPEYTVINKNNIKQMHKELNKFTHVFCHSVPANKGYSDEIKDGFVEMWGKIEKPFRIMMQVDHKIQSIARNANFMELNGMADAIVTHSDTSPFAEKLVKEFGSSVMDKFIKLHLSYNFDKLAKFRKTEHLKKITYLGRFAGFKEPSRIFGFAPHGVANELHLEAKGIERSIGALEMFYQQGSPTWTKDKVMRPDVIEVSNKALKEGLVTDDHLRELGKVYIFGPYDHDDGMEVLSRSLVGADFYHLDEKAYGDNFEYAMCEIVGVGTIPMFDHNWASNCHIYEKGFKTDKKFIDLDTYGFFVKKDLSNVPEIVDEINRVWDNPKLKQQYLDTAFEVTRAHCDSEYNLNRLISEFEKIEYRRNEEKVEEVTTEALW